LHCGGAENEVLTAFCKAEIFCHENGQWSIKISSCHKNIGSNLDDGFLICYTGATIFFYLQPIARILVYNTIVRKISIIANPRTICGRKSSFGKATKLHQKMKFSLWQGKSFDKSYHLLHIFHPKNVGVNHCFVYYWTFIELIIR